MRVAGHEPRWTAFEGEDYDRLMLEEIARFLSASPRRRVNPDAEREKTHFCVMFRLVLPAPDDEWLVGAMERSSLRLGVRFPLSELDDPKVRERIVKEAAEKMAGGMLDTWEALVFSDGSVIENPEMVQMEVSEIRTRPGGLFGTTHSFDVTVFFPDSSRGKL